MCRKCFDESVWTLTGNKEVSSLSINGNIKYDDYSVIVNCQKYDSSNPFKG